MIKNTIGGSSKLSQPVFRTGYPLLEIDPPKSLRTGRIVSKQYGQLINGIDDYSVSLGWIFMIGGGGVKRALPSSFSYTLWLFHLIFD